MTDSIRGTGTCPAAPATTDDYLRAATGAREGASAAHHADAHDPGHGIHVGVDAAAMLLEGASAEGVALGGLVGFAGMALDIASAWATWAQGPIEGARRGVEYDSEMMRGCLAAFEGRADEPEVRAYMEASPAFANGVRDAERIALRDPALFACVRAAVVSANEAGADAVFEGTDGSAAATARYETDLAFRHGVDEARGLRERDPAAFAARRAERHALLDRVSTERAGAFGRA